jgi:hypothetical protein
MMTTSPAEEPTDLMPHKKNAHRSPSTTNQPSGPQRSRQHVPPGQVAAELLPDQSAALLAALHLVARDGSLQADSRRKLKQINHLYQLLRPVLEPLLQRHPDEPQRPRIVDAGAGNAYLGFVLYELLLGPMGQGELVSVEVREDLVQRATSRATTLGFERMRFVQQAMAAVVADPGLLGGPIDAVVALHACDTATDDAIALGIACGAPVIAVVPCCQAECARLLDAPAAKKGAAAALWRFPMQRREFGAHLTNVLRAHVLESWGYQVTVTELTGWEHSLKNELILAKRIQRRNGQAIRQTEALLATLPPLDLAILRNPGLPPPVEAQGEAEAQAPSDA